MTATHDESITLVTGASSGIGLALCQHFLENGAEHVYAVSRSATRAPALDALQQAHAGRLQRQDVDITRDDERARLVQTLSGKTLTRLVNCAGVLHDNAQSLQPEKRVEELSRHSLETAFTLNAFAPILLMRDMLVLVDRKQPCVFASLSARVGSIADNGLGGWYSYRAAKAAQNQLLKTFAIEMRRRRPALCVLALHPGTTDTPLSRPFQRNVPEGKLFQPQYVAKRLSTIMDQATAQDSGRFVAWDGTDIPW